MKIIRSPKAMMAWSQGLRREGVTIGFVPTMGALHDGHRALIRAARLKCDALVVSIFVNPAQFGPSEDLSKYPRPITKDRALCRQEGVDISFEPTAATMYPEGFQTTVTVPDLARRWEGAIRPHHFAGVATVVTKLFGMVRPDLALFGQKDFQQATLVRRLIEDLNLGVTLTIHPTVREQDGLAMSSRNVYLSPEERAVAPVLYKTLQAGVAAIRGGIKNGGRVQSLMAETLREHSDAAIDYLAVCDPQTLDPLQAITSQAVLLGAIRIGAVRLIDNVLVSVPAKKMR